jgi:short-subunit dehydrogenase
MSRQIFITGASSGFGWQLALDCAEAGAGDLVLTARREERLKELAALCQDLGAKATVVAGDISDDSTQAALAGGIDAGADEIVLVNNAGIVGYGLMGEHSSEAIKQTIDVNLTATIQLTNLLVPAMLERNCGRVINVSSVSAEMTFPGCSVYSATKAGMLMFSAGLSEEVRKQGVLVTTVMPGPARTEIWPADSEFDKSKMMPASAVSEQIRDLILMPRDRNIDKLTIMPPEGTL